MKDNVKRYMFTASWCGQCLLVKPIVEKIIGVEIIDIEKFPELQKKYNIMGLPTFIYDTGDSFNIKTGACPRQVLEEFYGIQ